MNKRKVQLTGGGTYFVTLPKQWATRMKIGRGAEISLEENATGSLLLVPPTLAGENRVSLSLEDKDPLWIERAIISCRSPSARLICACLSPSDSAIVARFSRSARICFSIASLML